MLVHLVELAPLEGDPEGNYETVRAELAAYGAGLERLPELVVLSKRDLLAGRGGRGGGRRVDGAPRRPRARRAGDLLGDRRGAGRAAPADPRRAAGGPLPAGGRRRGRRRVRGRAPRLPARRARAATGSSRRGTAPSGSRGRGVELLFERHDIKNEEALAYLEQRLGEIGVIAALAKAGFEAGDDVRIGEHEFELHI